LVGLVWLVWLVWFVLVWLVCLVWFGLFGLFVLFGWVWFWFLLYSFVVAVVGASYFCISAFIYYQEKQTFRQQLLGAHETWRTALEEHMSGHKMAYVFNVINGSIEEQKREWETDKRREIRSIDWVSVVNEIDPTLFSYNLQSICWHCGKQGSIDNDATDPSNPSESLPSLLQCNRCRRARYCSLACQKASWYHHKGSLTEQYKCIEAPKANAKVGGESRSSVKKGHAK
jgi:hypothetical protein